MKSDIRSTTCCGLRTASTGFHMQPYPMSHALFLRSQHHLSR
jgi:hypothetical protein